MRNCYTNASQAGEGVLHIGKRSSPQCEQDIDTDITLKWLWFSHRVRTEKRTWYGIMLSAYKCGILAKGRRKTSLERKHHIRG